MKIYPLFLGVDGSGDFVWEREDGRWTWGEDPHDAACKMRTFEPVDYIAKYGRPIGLNESIDRKAEADEDPAELLKLYQDPPVSQASPSTALAVMLQVLNSWVEGAKENHEALGHRGESTGSECWTQFHPDDIRNMINDVAREIRVPEPWKKDGEKL